MNKSLLFEQKAQIKNKSRQINLNLELEKD